MFPSPLGVSYFQIEKGKIMKTLMPVSVPSRGILFPNTLSIILLILILTVSVPSRGILFPNANLSGANLRSAKFPSPLGVSYFQIDYVEK